MQLVRVRYLSDRIGHSASFVYNTFGADNRRVPRNKRALLYGRKPDLRTIDTTSFPDFRRIRQINKRQILIG